MMDKWKISSIVYDPTLVAKVKDEMLKEIERNKLLKAKKSSKLQRSTPLSESIGENYRMMKCLQDVTKDSECNNLILISFHFRHGAFMFVAISR